MKEKKVKEYYYKVMDVKLDVYEGPLDLLLRLIHRHEIDIYDIPISFLTTQYIQEITNLPPNMGELSEFLVMAATLLEIKSRMLLPRQKMEQDIEQEDPRAALAQKLEMYQQAQTVAHVLNRLDPVGERLTNRGDTGMISQLYQDTKGTFETDVTQAWQLAFIFTEAMNRMEDRRDTVRADYGSMARDRFTVTEKVLAIGYVLAQYGRASLRALFADCRSRNEIVVTFLALLEMIRQGQARVIQPASFDDVEVLTCTPH